MSSRSFTRPVDHKEYIRMKYGDGSSSVKGKKTKRKGLGEIGKGTNLRIVDDDVQMKMVKSEKSPNIYFAVNEDKPVIAEVIDDRPTAIKNKESKSKWKSLESNDESKCESKNSTKNSGSSHSNAKSSKVKHGLASAAEMREERKRFKEMETQMFQQLDTKISGKGAKSVFRDRKTGRVIDLEKEKAEYDAKTAKERQKFKEMTTGLKQVAEMKKQVQEEEKVMTEPLARHQDSAAFLDYCAQQKLTDDPMMAYVQEKEKEKVKESEIDDKKKAKIPWRGSILPPPNRFNIQPGHRWDGVDRSNGFEVKYFAKLAEKNAVKEEAYRWSTEDM